MRVERITTPDGRVEIHDNSTRVQLSSPECYGRKQIRVQLISQGQEPYFDNYSSPGGFASEKELHRYKRGDGLIAVVSLLETVAD